MSTQRYISTSFWDDEWIQTLDPSEKLLYLYLMTNPLTNIAGVYKITIRRICFDTGFHETVIGFLFEKFKNAGKAYRIGEYVVLPSWPKHQKWETKKAICDGIVSILNDLDDTMKNKLAEIKYRFDLSLLDHPPIIPPSSPHQPSYLNSNSNSNSNSDSDINLESPSTSDTPQKHTFFQVESTTKAIEDVRNHWNSKGLPKYNYTPLNLPGEARTKIIGALSVNGIEVVKQSIDNYVEIISKPSQYEYDPKFQYRSFPNFMERGVDMFATDSKPFERYSRNKNGVFKQEIDRTVPERTPEEDAEIQARLKEKMDKAGVI